MKTTTDYTNRLIDLELLQTIIEPVGVKRVSISIAQSVPKVVTGIQKLVQRYTNLFLTQAGDIQFATDIGTNFIPSVASGVIVNFGRFFEVFATANTSVIAQLKSDIDNLDNDEIISTAKLLDFDINTTTGVVTLVIQIVSMAGDAVDFVLPTATLQS